MTDDEIEALADRVAALLIADTTEDEDRATDALDVAGQEVLSLLAGLDATPTGEGT